MSDICSETRGRHDRSLAFWALHIGLPAVLLTAALAAGYVGGAVKQALLDSNTSIQETVTGALVIAAGASAAYALARPARPLDWKLKAWLVLFVAAMIFFAGEDLNWGQYYLDRTPSDFFLENNREQESNLHNMWPLLFNRLPRAIIEIWLVIACILVPFGWRLPPRLTQSFVPAVLWPDARIAFAATLVVVVRMLRQASSWVANPDYWLFAMRHSEVEELMIACCLLFYALMLRERLASKDP